MSSVDPVSSAYNQTAGESGTAGGTKNLGKTEFLELLVTQLKNQDPMNPVNNEQFISQLATFSSLEQLISINEAVSKLADGTTAVTENAADNESGTLA